MKVLLTGARGFLGSYVRRCLERKGHTVYDKHFDLMDFPRVVGEMMESRADSVIHCAGVVGGMFDNAKRPADYLTYNTIMGLNVLRAATILDLWKVVVAGSSCMYPEAFSFSSSPADLWNGRPYEGNIGYGIAKRVVSEATTLYRKQFNLNAFTAVLPNLYGPGADGTEKGHFVASVARKFIGAAKNNDKSVQMVGDGEAKRELIYVEDAAKALVYALEADLGPGPLNMGVGRDYTIKEVAGLISEVVGFQGEILWGDKKDNGQEKKLMDSNEAFSLGWSAGTPIKEGIRKTVESITL